MLGLQELPGLPGLSGLLALLELQRSRNCRTSYAGVQCEFRSRIYFSKILKADEELDIDMRVVTMEEVKDAIYKLQPGTAFG